MEAKEIVEKAKAFREEMKEIDAYQMAEVIRIITSTKDHVQAPIIFFAMTCEEIGAEKAVISIKGGKVKLDFVAPKGKALTLQEK